MDSLSARGLGCGTFGTVPHDTLAEGESDRGCGCIACSGPSPPHLSRPCPRYPCPMLVLYCGGMIQPEELSFRSNTWGKPEIEWGRTAFRSTHPSPPPLRFNLSHTSSLVALAVSSDIPVGLDVEDMRRGTKKSAMEVARRRFSAEEARWLGSFQDPAEQSRRFLQLWTLKEAYVKAEGKGMNEIPFRSFSFSFSDKNEASSLLARETVRSCTNLECVAEPGVLTMRHEEKGEDEPFAKCQGGVSHARFLSVQATENHLASICTLVPRNRKHDSWKVSFWATKPLVDERELHEASALAISC